MKDSYLARKGAREQDASLADLVFALKLTARVAHASHAHTEHPRIDGFETCTRLMCFDAKTAIAKARGEAVPR